MLRKEDDEQDANDAEPTVQEVSLPGLTFESGPPDVRQKHDDLSRDDWRRSGLHAPSEYAEPVNGKGYRCGVFGRRYHVGKVGTSLAVMYFQAICCSWNPLILAFRWRKSATELREPCGDDRTCDSGSDECVDDCRSSASSETNAKGSSVAKPGVGDRKAQRQRRPETKVSRHRFFMTLRQKDQSTCRHWLRD